MRCTVCHQMRGVHVDGCLSYLCVIASVAKTYLVANFLHSFVRTVGVMRTTACRTCEGRIFAVPVGYVCCQDIQCGPMLVQCRQKYGAKYQQIFCRACKVWCLSLELWPAVWLDVCCACELSYLLKILWMTCLFLVVML